MTPAVPSVRRVADVLMLPLTNNERELNVPLLRGLLLSVALIGPSAFAQPFHVDFEGIPSGTAAEALSTPGVTFRPSPPGSWVVEEAFFTGLRGQMLFQPNTTGTIDIVFAVPVTSVSFDFAQNSTTVGETALVVEAFRAGAPTGSVRVPTTFIGQVHAEGAVSFATATPFDTIRLRSDPVVLIAIDNISAPAGQVPTPRPADASFSVVPEAIAFGQEATLRWSVPGSAGVTIDNGIGTQPPSGAIVVRPAQTTTYNLTATQSGTPVALQAHLIVVAAPATAVTAPPRGMAQLANTGGANDSFVVTNVGGATASVTVQAQGTFFSVAPSSFSLPPGTSRDVTITAAAQPPDAYSGTVSVSTAGLPEDISIPVRMVSAVAPSGTVTPQATTARVDLSSSGTATVSGTVTFRNDGSATLQGIVVSDQPWVIPESGLITIAPGQSRAVSFTIDPIKRAVDEGSEQAELSLVYVGGTGAPIRLPAALPQGNSTSSISVSLVHTKTPSVSGGGIPGLAEGQTAWFVPGLVRNNSVISDVIALLRPASPSPTSLNLFYLPGSASANAARVASFSSVAPSATLPLSDVIKSVYNDPSTVGTVQIRSATTHPVAVSGKMFNVSRAQGLVGTSLVSFRHDRGVSASQRVVIPGIRKDASTSTDLFVQEVSGIDTAMRVDFLGSAGQVILTRSENVPAFAVRELIGVVPEGAVTAMITNTGVGRLVARALLNDASGDVTDLVDWTVRNGIGATDPQVIPLLDQLGGTGTRKTELIIANRGPETLRATLSAAGGSRRRRAVRLGTTGGSGPTTAHGQWTAQRHSLTAGTDATMEITLPAGQTTVIPDVLSQLGAASASHVVFTPVAGTASITARRSTTSAFGTLTTNLPVVSGAVSIGLAESREFGGVEAAGRRAVEDRQPASFRSSLLLVETAGRDAVVRVTLQFTQPVSSGLVSLRGQGSKNFSVGAGRIVHIEDLATEILGISRTQLDDLRNMKVDVVVLSGEGKVAPLMVEAENGTGDLILRLE